MVSIAGCWAVRQAVQLGVEKTTNEWRPSGEAPRAAHRLSAAAARKPARPRRDHQRARITVAATATAATARTTARSTISGPVKDAAPVQLRHHEAQGAEVDARIQRDHDRDRKGEHPGQDRIAGQQRRGRQQPDGTTDRPRDPSSLVILVDDVTLEDPGGLEDPPDQLPD